MSTTWAIEHVEQLNVLADDTDLGGVYRSAPTAKTRINRRYKDARSALKAYLRESTKLSVGVDQPKESGRTQLCVRRHNVLEASRRARSETTV